MRRRDVELLLQFLSARELTILGTFAFFVLLFIFSLLRGIIVLGFVYRSELEEKKYWREKAWESLHEADVTTRVIAKRRRRGE